MIKFWFIYVSGIYISYKLITAKKTKELARMQIEERWSELRIQINDLMFPIINVLGVILVISLIIPLTRDIPNAIKQKTEEQVGIVKKVECKYFCLQQNIYIEESVQENLESSIDENIDSANTESFSNKTNEEINEDTKQLTKYKLFISKKVARDKQYKITYLPKNRLITDMEFISRATKSTK